MRWSHRARSRAPESESLAILARPYYEDAEHGAALSENKPAAIGGHTGGHGATLGQKNFLASNPIGRTFDYKWPTVSGGKVDDTLAIGGPDRTRVNTWFEGESRKGVPSEVKRPNIKVLVAYAIDDNRFLIGRDSRPRKQALTSYRAQVPAVAADPGDLVWCAVIVPECQ